MLKIGILNNTDPLNTFPHQVHSSSGVLCTNRGHSGYFLLCGHRHFSFLVEAIVLFLSFVLATLFTGKFRVEETINCKNPFLTVILILRVSNTFLLVIFLKSELAMHHTCPVLQGEMGSSHWSQLLLIQTPLLGYTMEHF